MTHFQKHYILAHRFTWERWHGSKVPRSKILGSYCGTAYCVNPEHHYVTTYKALAKIYPPPRGEQTTMARLTEIQVKDIRAQYAAGVSIPRLATAFGRPAMTIRGIVLGISWRHLLDPPTPGRPGTRHRQDDTRLSRAEWNAIKAAYGYRCVYCGCKPERLTKDHLTPWIHGGMETIHNIVPACGACNTRKKHGPVLRPVQPLLLLAV